jgi:hypothetical protein
MSAAFQAGPGEGASNAGNSRTKSAGVRTSGNRADACAERSRLHNEAANVTHAAKITAAITLRRRPRERLDLFLKLPLFFT